ncbi:FAD/FMN-containing dehydrogenase [Kaistia soli DSM 19436]|uniref:FAD/FMN-containing dehydrogenase n=1 Tax=Kaistia soli DSM 19436 TaxID=1122133 RepID=A0A1M5J9A6_9HYPH|nr:FAD-binding oxidoreductase [Kaistia soli]SHG37152.1 FAD/FMN-containing dehydrogenase [Kaistia soli DSM 19436]
MARTFSFDLDALKRDLDGIELEDNPALVKQKSRDFFWYSPVLKRQLDDVTGDLVATPKDEDEVIRILAAAFKHDVPVTPRGAGTGNYGQAMPLSGGLILNLTAMNKVKAILPGRVIAEPGVIMAQLDRETRAHSGQELRLHPSTANTATIGGFIAGGSGGVGSIRWGGLRDLGNVIRLRVVTMEAAPRVLDLSGWELHKVMHAYGTNGIITEVEMPLTAAYDWVDVLVGFDDYMDSVRYADLLGNSDGLLLKEIATVAAPVPETYFLRHQKFIKMGQSLAILMVAPQSLDAFLALTEREKGDVIFRSDTASDLKGIPPNFELAWNHTTLRALRVDPAITYLQTMYAPPHHLEKIARMTALLGDEVPGHLEFVRFDGKITPMGLPMLRFTTEARLDEIVRLHEDNGCPVFNPHRYTLEEGGMKQTDAIQLAFKHEADPKGLLNPGKMIAFEDPDFDFAAQKTYLFPGLRVAS